MAGMSTHALIVHGGWNGHTPAQSAEVCATALRAAGYEVTMRDSLDAYVDNDLMKTVDLIVPIWTMGELADAQWQGLSAAVRAGAGCAGFHGGIVDAFRSHCEYQMMTGGQFVGHPGNCIASYRVAIVDRDHEITRGLGDFDLNDTEQYYMHVDPGVDVLATTTFTGGHGDTDTYAAGTVMPYAWTRSWGQGRVFVAAWGHTFKDFDTPQALEIVKRGMLWAARKK